MKTNKINLQSGFSTVEILISMVIFTILSGIVTINLLNVKHSTSLNTTLTSFLTDLKQQQLKAMVGDTEGRVSNSAYGIHFDTTSYTLFHDTYTVGDSSNLVVTLPDTLQISTAFTGSKIVFTKGSGEVSGAPNTITLTDTSNTQQKVITVNAYGVVTQIN